MSRGSAELDGNFYTAQFCAGTLIDSRWVLTAAHCVDSSSAYSLLVLIGSSNLQAPVTQPVSVNRVIVHEEWNGNIVEGKDIALLELELNAQVPASPLDIEPLTPGDTAFIAGWGAVNSGSDGSIQQYPPVIRGAFVQMLPGLECGARYPLIGDYTDETNICANATGVDTCQGDSGGPMYRVSQDGNAPYSLTGITSWGIGCANPEAPGVYTNVSSYVDWILANTGSTTITTSSAPPSSPELPVTPDPAPVALPEIISPVPGSELTGETVTFQWTGNDTPVREWYFKIGSQAGAQEFADLRITNPAINRWTFSGLPVDGRRLFVQFSFKNPVTGKWTVTNVEYKAHSSDPEAPPFVPTIDIPTIVSPLPGTVLSSNPVTFEWSSNGTPVHQWYLKIGDKPGGENYTNVRILSASQTAMTVDSLPSDGQPLFVEFSYKNPYNGTWATQNFVYYTSTR